MQKNKPKFDFKSILAKYANNKPKFAIKGPDLKLIKPKKLSIEEREIFAENLKKMKKLVNSSFCPLCKSQLDGGIYHDRSNVYCASHPNEYTATFVNYMEEPKESAIRFVYRNYAYIFKSVYISPGNYNNQVDQFDLSFYYPNNGRKTILTYDGQKVINNDLINEEYLIRKIKDIQMI